MATQKQIEANRRNALKSTGPSTPEGKARSSRNALTHSLNASDLLLQSEDLECYRQRLEEATAEFQPSTFSERDLVHRFVLTSIRLDRAARAEAQTVRRSTGDFTDTLNARGMENVLRYERHHQRVYRQLYDALVRIQAERAKALREQQQAEREIAGTKPISALAYLAIAQKTIDDAVRQGLITPPKRGLKPVVTLQPRANHPKLAAES